MHWLGVAALAWAVLGCGGGDAEPSDPAVQPTTPAFLAGAKSFASADTPLPEGYEAITLDAAAQRFAAGGVDWIGGTDAEQAGAQQRARDEAALTRLRAAAQTDPQAAQWLALPEPGGRGISVRPDGSVLVEDETGDPALSVVLDPVRNIALGAGRALLRADSKDNQLAIFRMHWETLAEEDRAALPSPEAAAGLDDAALREAVAAAAAKVVETVPNGTPAPADTPSDGNAAPATADGRSRKLSADDPACPTLPGGSLLAVSSFPLKSYLPTIRSQGNRGTCVSFAISAALETRIARLYNRNVDFSEQHLYSVAKGDWAPTPGGYGDGLFSDDVLDEMADRPYWTRSEPEWRYNRSSSRLDLFGKYERSCEDYDATCSNANHQAVTQCFAFAGKWYCGRARPGNANNVERYRVTGHTSLGMLSDSNFNSLAVSQTMLNIQAALLAHRPVVLDMALPGCFRLLKSATEAVDAFFTVARCQNVQGEATIGNHAMTIVGYVTNLEVASRYNTVPGFRGIEGDLFSDGFYIVRNSWGCGFADAGYFYLSSRALRRYGYGVYAVNGAAQQNLPTVSLAANRSTVDAITQTLRLTATAGSTVRSVTFKARPPGSSGPWTTIAVDAVAPFSYDVLSETLASRVAGTWSFMASAVDDAQNAVDSPVLQVKVTTDNVPPPQVTLVVSADLTSTTSITEALAPGSVRLRATVTPSFRPVAHVAFYKGLALWETVTLSPYRSTVSLGVADVGTVGLTARVVDVDGRFNVTTVAISVKPAVALPVISGFAATPATTAPGGGTSTLSWNASGFDELSIDKVGRVSNLSSVQVSPNVTTTYTMTATGPGGTATASTTVTVPPPQVASFTATPASLPVGGGPVTLSWNVVGAASVNINNGVGSVAGTGSVLVNPVVSTSWTLLASAPSGSSNASAAVTVAGDGVPPTVSLAAAPTTVNAPGSTVLTATAGDNVGVVAVDFYRGATRIATDTTPGDGFTHTVAFTTADVGSASFTAVARDAAANTGTSAAVVVTVVVPVPLGVDRWVAPTGNDNNPGSQAQPYLTVGKALANIGASGTAWLAAGIYPWANEINRNGYSQVDMKVLRVPDTGRVRATTRGTVTLNFGLQALGSAVISGVHFTLRADDAGDAQPSVLSKGASGTLRVERATFGRLNNLQFSTGSNTLFTAEGDNTHEWFTPEFQGAFGRVDAGFTRFLGGRITLNRIPDGGNAGARVWGNYAGSGQLSFERVSVTLPEAPAGVFQVLFVPVQGGSLTFFNSQVVQQGTRTSHVLAQNDHLSHVRLLNSTVSGPFAQIVSLTVGGNVEVNGSTLSGGVTGIGFAGGQEPGGVAPPNVQILDSTLRNFSAHGLHLPHHGSVLISGSTLRDNGQTGAFLGGTPNLPWVTANYTLRLQTSTFSGNGSGGADQGGLVLAGASTSSWDLGGFNGMGNNTLLGTGSSPALRVAVPSGVTVLAVGNTWTPSVQGANASGQYGTDVVATAGSGANYVVSSGALRLSY